MLNTLVILINLCIIPQLTCKVTTKKAHTQDFSQKSVLNFVKLSTSQLKNHSNSCIFHK